MKEEYLSRSGRRGEGRGWEGEGRDSEGEGEGRDREGGKLMEGGGMGGGGRVANCKIVLQRNAKIPKIC